MSSEAAGAVGTPDITGRTPFGNSKTSFGAAEKTLSETISDSPYHVQRLTGDHSNRFFEAVTTKSFR